MATNKQILGGGFEGDLFTVVLHDGRVVQMSRTEFAAYEKREAAMTPMERAQRAHAERMAELNAENAMLDNGGADYSGREKFKRVFRRGGL